jgi:hypothetical protein
MQMDSDCSGPVARSLIDKRVDFTTPDAIPAMLQRCVRRVALSSCHPFDQALFWKAYSIRANFEGKEERSQINDVILVDESHGVLVGLQLPAFILNADGVNVNPYDLVTRVALANAEQFIRSENRDLSPIMN